MSRRSTNVISEKNQIGNKVEGDCNVEITEASKLSMSVVKIKTEPNCDVDDQTTTISTELGSSNSVYEQHKSIGTSNTSSDARLDLGTHLKDSLSSMVSNEKLTWSNLLQGGSLPKVHIPENTVTIKKEKVDLNSPDVVICSTDDDTIEENPSGRNDEKVQGQKRSATVKNGSCKDLTLSSNKNTSTSGDGNDANKKVIPPQIRRVLASKFGVLKRYEDGQPGGIAPNLTKSRSRFIQCLKPNVVNNSEEGKSLSSSDVEETRKKPGDDKDDDVESPPKCRSVSPFHNLANPALAGKLSNRRRFSSSAYEVRGVPAFIKKEPPSEVDYNFGLQSGSHQRISSLMQHSSYSSNVNSTAPLDTENMTDLRTSARNWKNHPTKAKLNETATKGNNSYGMINLNTSPYSMNFGTSGDRIPFSGKPRYAHKSSESSSKQRSSSRSPVHNERSVGAETQQPMIELSSNSRKFNSFAPGMTRSEEGRKSISPVRPEHWHYDKARSVSPVMNDTRGNRSPYKPRANDESDRQTGALREAATRINNEATVRYHNRLSPKGNHVTKSPPMIELRSTTRSLDQSMTNKSTSDNRMIDLNHTSRIHERRGAPVMKPINAMIDLNSTDNPASPSSPGFGLNLHSNFPSQAYRSCNRGLRYPAYKPQRGRVPLVASPGLGSPGFSPRIQYGGTHFNYPPSPLYHVADRPTDFGSPKKQTKLPNKPSNLSIEQGEESKHVQKRPNSTDLSNANMPVKRQRIETDQNYEGRGVALNVVDLLELEREEQKYIQELSTVQSRVTSTQFKIQRLQQEFEQLQTSEADLKRRIDAVRAKRVRILTDAQEKHGFQREERSSPSKIADKESKNVLMKQDEEELNPRNESRYDGKNMTGRKESDKFDSMDDKGGFHQHHMETDDDMKKNDCDDGDGKLRDTWGSKSHLGGTVKDIDNSSKGYHKMNHYETRAVSPEVVLRNAPIFSDPRSSTDVPSVPHWQEETFEGSNGSLITLRSDGTVILGKRQTHHASLHKKHTHSAVLKDIKVTSLDVRSTSGDVTKGKVPYFSGCVEITSTTEEPVLRESEPPKEVIAEKERASLASAIRCDQDSISSTVHNFDRDQAQNENAVALQEMDYVGHTDAVGCIVPFKGKLYSASVDNTVRVFDLKTGECLRTYEDHRLAVNCLQISRENNVMYTGSSDQTVCAYDIKSGSCTYKFSFRGRVMCLHVAFGKLFVGLSSGYVTVVDLKTNECIDQFNCHVPNKISCLSSGTEGQRSLICTGSFDATITIRDQMTGLLIRHIKDHKLTVLCMQVVENVLYSGSADTVVRSHNINTGELLRSYSGHTMSVSGLQALGGVLVTSSLDKIVRCYDIETGELLQLYGGNTNMIFSLCVLGSMIYTGCRDGRLSSVKLDLRKYHSCKWRNCSLKFGVLSHFKQHVEDHINETVNLKDCFWGECLHKFFGNNQPEVIQEAKKHILSHVEMA